MIITSPHNQKLKQIRRLARRRGRDAAGRFVAEGEDLLAAADARRLAGARALRRRRQRAAGHGGRAGDPRPRLGARLGDAGAGRLRGALGRAPSGPLCVCLWGVADPGNVGTALRTAAAFGVASVALGPDCADPYGPKAVRASMGAVFTVPLARVTSLAELPGRTIALAARAGEPLRGPLEGDVTLLVGAERAGLPEEIVDGAAQVAHIPIATESLNAAIAAAIALYEITRDPGAGTSPPSGE